MYCLDRKTGAVNWKYDVSRDGGQSFHGNMLIDGDWILVGTDIGMVEKGGYLTGKEIWKVPLPLPEGKNFIINKPPALLGEQLYYGAANGKLYAFASAPGAKRIIKDFSSPIITPIVAHEGFLYLGTEAGKLYRVNHANGEIAGEFALNGRPHKTIFAHDEIYFPDNL